MQTLKLRLALRPDIPSKGLNMHSTVQQPFDPNTCVGSHIKQQNKLLTTLTSPMIQTPVTQAMPSIAQTRMLHNHCCTTAAAVGTQALSWPTCTIKHNCAPSCTIVFGQSTHFHAVLPAGAGEGEGEGEALQSRHTTTTSSSSSSRAE
jgi:hypothetical protein